MQKHRIKYGFRTSFYDLGHLHIEFMVFNFFPKILKLTKNLAFLSLGKVFSKENSLKNDIFFWKKKKKIDFIKFCSRHDMGSIRVWKTIFWIQASKFQWQFGHILRFEVEFSWNPIQMFFFWQKMRKNIKFSKIEKWGLGVSYCLCGVRNG